MIKKILFTLCFIVLSHNSFAAFPDDFTDVVFIEEGNRSVGITQAMPNFPITATLNFAIGGPDNFGGNQVILNYSKANSWPGITSLNLNANCWIFVKIGSIWYAGTWEFMRKGQIVKSTKALNGAHIQLPPLNAFLPKNGEIYGFMVAGITRLGLNKTNAFERSHIALWKWGVGPVGYDAVRPPAAPETPTIGPAVDLLMNDD